MNLRISRPLYTAMRFCSQCANMYYIRVSEEDPNAIVYYCRNCGHTDTSVPASSMVISSTSHRPSGRERLRRIVNPFTKLDPTLPRITNVLCPNADCASNKDDGAGEREIIYLRTDAADMRCAYLCATCDVSWTEED